VTRAVGVASIESSHRSPSLRASVGQMPPRKKCASALTVGEVEAALEEWFGLPVVLTSSGRGALMLAFDHLGLQRYRNRIVITPMISACVLDAVVRHAFPIDAESNAESDATLVYHQYGFIQTVRPPGPVIEDICHSFYAGPTSGRRAWLGELAVFSLPKFFSTSSAVGGLVVHNRALADSVRERRDAEPERSVEQQDEEASIHCAPDAPNLAMSQMYLSRLLNRQVADRELGGVPKDISEIVIRGRQRGEIIATYCDAVGADSCPNGWHDMLRERLPYFFPVSGEETRLLHARSRLREFGVEAEIYSIDVSRNMSSPSFVKMLLLPCHDQIPDQVLLEIASTLRWLKANRDFN